MKQETKGLVEWIKNLLLENKSRCKGNIFDFERFDKAVSFLNSLSEIELHLCRGGYIQDKNGTPCCDGDKVRFEFEDKTYKENWKGKYSKVMEGELQFSVETKSFAIIFGPDIHGYDWIDWTTSDYGCKWFEKVNE